MLKSEKISEKQLLGMMLLSRMFVMLVYVPSSYQATKSLASILILFTGFLLTLFAIIPVWLLLKQYQGKDLIDVTAILTPKLHKPVAILFYLLCMLVAVESMVQFEMFMTTAVYPIANRTLIILIFSAAVFYMVYMGLEAITRTSFIIAVMVFIVWVIVILGLVNYIDTLNLYSPLYDGIKPIITGSYLIFAQNTEIVACILLLPFLNKHKGAKAFIWYNTLATLSLAIIGIVAICVLGNYGKSRTFPMYTLMAISGSEIFYRLDYLHIMMWIAIAMIRCALYLYLATRLIEVFLGKNMHNWGKVVNVILTTGFAIICSKNIAIFNTLYKIIVSGFPMVILVVILPVILLSVQLAKSKRGTLPKVEEAQGAKEEGNI